MNDKDKSLQILRAAGVWEHIAVELVEEYSLRRISIVANYVVNTANYDYPGPAVVKGLREDWQINKDDQLGFDKERLNELLTEANGQ